MMTYSKNKAILNNYCFKRLKYIKTETKTEIKRRKLKDCYVFNSNKTLQIHITSINLLHAYMSLLLFTSHNEK